MFDGLVFTLTFYTSFYSDREVFNIVSLHINNEATWIFIKCCGSGVDYVRTIFHMKRETAY